MWSVEESLLSQVTRAHSAACEKPTFLNWMPLRCFSPKWSLRFQYNLSDKNTWSGRRIQLSSHMLQTSPHATGCSNKIEEQLEGKLYALLHCFQATSRYQLGMPLLVACATPCSSNMPWAPLYSMRLRTYAVSYLYTIMRRVYIVYNAFYVASYEYKRNIN